ncbi:MAG: stage II sporulation protein M [Bifidobacteriaceae bacterium]|nr:stage II sporulation protein M [Bifidobacteriaceae bacterium]
MDIEAFVAERAPAWERLGALAAKRLPTGAEADELAWLYERVATDLSQLRSEAPDPALVSQLSAWLAAARARILGAHDTSTGALRRFVELTMPQALYRVRWWALVCTAVCLATALVCGFWVVSHPSALAVLGTAEERQAYVDSAFADYYSEYAHSSFAAYVWTNNARVSALCLAGGITGFFPALMLFENSVQLGATGGMMTSYGAGDVFFSLILPHGLLELTCVFVSGAVGLRLFWAWVAPGPRTRAQSLAREGKAAAAAVVALSVALGVSGLVEGFITPSDLPSPLKITIGALALAAFLVYMVGVGRRATRILDAENSERRRLDE